MRSISGIFILLSRTPITLLVDFSTEEEIVELYLCLKLCVIALAVSPSLDAS